MELRVGCAMWANTAWFGRSLPTSTTPKSALRAYAASLNAVEGNTTFYALPKPDAARRWADSVPDGFRFVFKLPRVVTHERKLRGASEQLAEFLRATEPCHAHMDPVSIQLPPSFEPGSLDTLEAFVATLPTSLRWAVEVRHPGFFDDADGERGLNDLLFSRSIDRVILDSRAVFAGPCITKAEQDAFANKPRLPVRAVATSERPIVRFIGQTDFGANPPFWEPWIDTVVRWLKDGRTPTVFIHTPDNLVAPELCRQFHLEVRARCPALSSLPEAPPDEAPSLFD